MKSSAAYRDAAWNSLSGNWGSAVVFTLVYFVIACIAGVIDGALALGSSVVTALLTAPVTYSYNR